MPEAATRPLDQLIYILRYKLPSLQKKTIIAGFDGFVDTLVKPIRKYGTDRKPEFFNSIEEFGVSVCTVFSNWFYEGIYKTIEPGYYCFFLQ